MASSQSVLFPGRPLMAWELDVLKNDERGFD